MRYLTILVIVTLTLFVFDKAGLLSPIKAPLNNLLAPVRLTSLEIQNNLLESMAVVTEASRVNSKRRELEIENASLKAENQKLAQLQKDNQELKDQLKV